MSAGTAGDREADRTAADDGFSWDLLAAELVAAELEDDAAEQQEWDAAAARLASALGPGPGSTVPAAPAAPRSPDTDLGGRPAPRTPVEFEVLPEADADVEESTAVAPDTDPGDAHTHADIDGHPDPVELRGGLEALLFVADGPVDEVTLADALDVPVAAVRTALAGLAAGYDERRAGMVLRRVGEGWRLYTRDEHAPVVERHLLGGQRNRLTQAALETLAVIAYRQPVTRARVSAIRGVGVDAVVRTLVARGLVSERGTDPGSGAGLYVTTPLFLERLGLTSLDELPELAPLLPETQTVLDERPDS